MLKHFIYLNEPALDSYLSSLEDGLRGAVQEKSGSSSSVSGKAGVGGVGVGGDRDSQREETVSRNDTASARFERLQRLARQEAESVGWVDVVAPDTDLAGIGIGAIVEIECEIFIPEMIKALSPTGGLVKAIDQVQALAPLASLFGSDITGLPPTGQMDAMKGLANTLDGDAVVVGERDDSDWRVAGKLLDQYLSGEVEGYARLVGKVSTVLRPGSWKPLLARPGMNLMGRDKRREMERKGPDEGQEDSWVKGPAIMIDVLAIYR